MSEDLGDSQALRKSLSLPPRQSADAPVFAELARRLQKEEVVEAYGQRRGTENKRIGNISDSLAQQKRWYAAGQHYHYAASNWKRLYSKPPEPVSLEHPSFYPAQADPLLACAAGSLRSSWTAGQPATPTRPGQRRLRLPPWQARSINLTSSIDLSCAQPLSPASESAGCGRGQSCLTGTEPTGTALLECADGSSRSSSSPPSMATPGGRRFYSRNGQLVTESGQLLRASTGTPIPPTQAQAHASQLPGHHPEPDHRELQAVQLGLQLQLHFEHHVGDSCEQVRGGSEDEKPCTSNVDVATMGMGTDTGAQLRQQAMAVAEDSRAGMHAAMLLSPQKLWQHASGGEAQGSCKAGSSSGSSSPSPPVDCACKGSSSSIGGDSNNASASGSADADVDAGHFKDTRDTPAAAISAGSSSGGSLLSPTKRHMSTKIQHRVQQLQDQLCSPSKQTHSSRHPHLHEQQQQHERQEVATEEEMVAPGSVTRRHGYSYRVSVDDHNQCDTQGGSGCPELLLPQLASPESPRRPISTSRISLTRNASSPGVQEARRASTGECHSKVALPLLASLAGTQPSLDDPAHGGLVSLSPSSDGKQQLLLQAPVPAQGPRETAWGSDCGSVPPTPSGPASPLQAMSRDAIDNNISIIAPGTNCSASQAQLRHAPAANSPGESSHGTSTGSGSAAGAGAGASTTPPTSGSTSANIISGGNALFSLFERLRVWRPAAAAVTTTAPIPGQPSSNTTPPTTAARIAAAAGGKRVQAVQRQQAVFAALDPQDAFLAEVLGLYDHDHDNKYGYDDNQPRGSGSGSGSICGDEVQLQACNDHSSCAVGAPDAAAADFPAAETILSSVSQRSSLGSGHAGRGSAAVSSSRRSSAREAGSTAAHEQEQERVQHADIISGMQTALMPALYVRLSRVFGLHAAAPAAPLLADADTSLAVVASDYSCHPTIPSPPPAAANCDASIDSDTPGTSSIGLASAAAASTTASDPLALLTSATSRDLITPRRGPGSLGDDAATPTATSAAFAPPPASVSASLPPLPASASAGGAQQQAQRRQQHQEHQRSQPVAVLATRPGAATLSHQRLNHYNHHDHRHHHHYQQQQQYVRRVSWSGSPPLPLPSSTLRPPAAAAPPPAAAPSRPSTPALHPAAAGRDHIISSAATPPPPAAGAAVTPQLPTSLSASSSVSLASSFTTACTPQMLSSLTSPDAPWSGPDLACSALQDLDHLPSDEDMVAMHLLAELLGIGPHADDGDGDYICADVGNDAGHDSSSRCRHHRHRHHSQASGGASAVLSSRTAASTPTASSPTARAAAAAAAARAAWRWRYDLNGEYERKWKSGCIMQ